MTLVSSFFLLKGNLGLSAEDIANLSTTRFNYSPGVLRALSIQTTDIWIGFGLLLVALLFQMINLLWPMRWEDYKFSWKGAISSIAFSLVVFLLAWVTSGVLSQRLHHEAEEILDQQGLRDSLEPAS